MLFFIIALHRSSTTASCGQPVQNVGGAGGNKGGRESGGGEGPRRGGEGGGFTEAFFIKGMLPKKKPSRGTLFATGFHLELFKGGHEQSVLR